MVDRIQVLMGGGGRDSKLDDALRRYTRLKDLMQKYDMYANRLELYLGQLDEECRTMASIHRQSTREIREAYDELVLTVDTWTKSRKRRRTG